MIGVLLRKEEAELIAVSEDGALDTGDCADRGQRLEIEVGESARELLPVECKAGERGGDIDGAELGGECRRGLGFTEYEGSIRRDFNGLKPRDSPSDMSVRNTSVWDR